VSDLFAGASTFRRQGYRFDARATLAAGFYPGGPMDLVAQAAGIDAWRAHPSDPAMVVHLPDGSAVGRWAGEERWTERGTAFGPASERFWRWQEDTAAALWTLALRAPPWPPQTPTHAARLLRLGVDWLADGLSRRFVPQLAADLLRIVLAGKRPVAVEIAGGVSVPADVVIANLPPWNVARLLGDQAPARLRRLSPKPEAGWGAFMLYLGVEGAAVPADLPLHHQVVAGGPLVPGNTVFVSLSPAWDQTRAPRGKRALTLSMHTDLQPWWDLYHSDRDGYQALKAEHTARALALAENALPGLREAADLILPGTPITYARYTRRAWGWVGGFPQTSLFRFWGPRLAPGLWLVGDSIFPGQSTVAVALGGLRVAKQIGIGTFLEH
jgi:phytoene dehydrogenase-like protein